MEDACYSCVTTCYDRDLCIENGYKYRKRYDNDINVACFEESEAEKEY